MEKWYGVLLLFLSFYEPVYGQCFLSIGLIQFQNLYSLEIRPNENQGQGPFCCCDVSSSTCRNSPEKISSDPCDTLCDTYFVLNFMECQDLAPCPVTMITDSSVDSATFTTVNYEFHFHVSSSLIEEVEFEMEMREEDANDGSFKEIDTFDIKATFPSDNQEQVFTGNRGVANITLTYDIICIEPDTCNTAVVSPELIDTCAVTDTTHDTSGSTTNITNTVNTTSIITSTHLINSTSTTTSTTITTSTSIEAQSVTMTATVRTVVTVSATPRVIRVTETVFANSSPGDPVGEQSAGSLDSLSIIWMSLFILFSLLTIIAVMISIYLACLLKKNRFKVDSKAGDVTLVQTNSVPAMDNPVYGSQGTSGKNGEENAHAAPSQEVYRTLANDLYADTSASPMNDYSTCGPAESPNNESYDYVQTRKPDISEATPYEVPSTLATSK